MEFTSFTSRFTIFMLLLCLCSFTTATRPNCQRCELVRCANKVDADCPVGIVREYCGCCDVCAKNIGERCRSPRNPYGICGVGLRCVNGICRR
uniref:Putative insulin-like protein growth factor binding protein n=1 Tax=Tityus obscurus TaxID=1221240 RepID=A0A1E1WVW6_TITOB